MIIRKNLTILCFLSGMTCFAISNAQAADQIIQNGAVTRLIIDQTAAKQAGVDYAGALPKTLPQAATQPPSVYDVILQAAGQSQNTTTTSGVSTGHPGTGVLNPVRVIPAISKTTSTSANSSSASSTGISSQDYGTGNANGIVPFTTSQTDALHDTTSKYYPFSAVGRLYFNEPSGTYVCSASLIKPGIIVTAAHCVANYGQNKFYTNWQFTPAWDNGLAPYGVISGTAAYVLNSYLNGTDSCAQAGVICVDDVALIVLSSNIGKTTGWLGYGYGNYGYANSNGVLLQQITQLGYPVALDGGSVQERTDSQGYVSGVDSSNNTIIGSLQTGGSSGGPWIMNLGTEPTLSIGSGVSYGSAPNHNIVVGVTSWGYNDNKVKLQGAAPFTFNNIKTLITTACKAHPSSC